MKKIFILTGEPSGDKLASKVISKLQKNNPNIEFSCVGGTHLNSLGIKSRIVKLGLFRIYKDRLLNSTEVSKSFNVKRKIFGI